MEELRPLIVDRLALALVNRRQLTAEHFEARPDAENEDEAPGDCDGPEEGEGTPPPPVYLNEAGRRIVLAAWRDRLCEEIHHPGAGRALPWRLVPHFQATHLRGLLARQEVGAYRPFCPRI